MTVRVLVVEDEELAAEAHAAYTRRVAGFEVVGVARSAGDAVRHLNEDPHVDLILLDMHLPDGHGLGLLQRLRAAGHLCDVIAVTSARDVDVVRHAVAQGVVLYLLKPFTFATFRAKLEQYAVYREQLADAPGEVLQDEVDQMLGSLRAQAAPAPAAQGHEPRDVQPGEQGAARLLRCPVSQPGGHGGRHVAGHGAPLPRASCRPRSGGPAAALRRQRSPRGRVPVAVTRRVRPERDNGPVIDDEAYVRELLAILTNPHPTGISPDDPYGQADDGIDRYGGFGRDYWVEDLRPVDDGPWAELEVTFGLAVPDDPACREVPDRGHDAGPVRTASGVSSAGTPSPRRTPPALRPASARRSAGWSSGTGCRGRNRSTSRRSARACPRRTSSGTSWWPTWADLARPDRSQTGAWR